MGSFILRTGRPRKDGRVTITFSGYVNNKRVYQGTGISVKPEDWDDARQQVRRTDVLYATLNARLREIESTFEQEKVTRVVSSDPFDIDVLRKTLSRRKPVDAPISTKDLGFWESYEQFMDAKGADRGDRTVAKYKTLKGLLKEIEAKHGPISFPSIDHDFYDRFKMHMVKKRKHTNNTVGKYISTFKTFLSWAEDRGLPVNPSFRKFKVDEEDVEVVALTWDELQLITDVDLSLQPRLDRVRDLFLFACYTGARFSDVQSLNKDDVRDGVWHLRMQKTKSETRIHLTWKAMAILQKYQAQKEWLPQISSQKMNTYLKEIGKLVELNEPVRIVRYQGAKRIEDRGPKWEYLTSHVARRTFVTLSLEKGMRPEVVMSITGHRSFKTMKKYIALNENGRKEDMDKVWG